MAHSKLHTCFLLTALFSAKSIFALSPVTGEDLLAWCMSEAPTCRVYVNGVLDGADLLHQRGLTKNWGEYQDQYKCGNREERVNQLIEQLLRESLSHAAKYEGPAAELVMDAAAQSRCSTTE